MDCTTNVWPLKGGLQPTIMDRFNTQVDPKKSPAYIQCEEHSAVMLPASKHCHCQYLSSAHWKKKHVSSCTPSGNWISLWRITIWKKKSKMSKSLEVNHPSMAHVPHSWGSFSERLSMKFPPIPLQLRTAPGSGPGNRKKTVIMDGYINIMWILWYTNDCGWLL